MKRTEKMNAKRLHHGPINVQNQKHQQRCSATRPSDTNKNYKPEQQQQKSTKPKSLRKKNFRAAATIEAKSKVTEAKNQDTSEIQKLIASKYPIVVLNKLPEQSAAETVNKEKLNEKQFTAISSRTRQKSKLATK